MNYQLHYDSIVHRAQMRILPPDQYTEKHHIIPRCMGGSDDITNLVELTPEEHFVAHQLLIKIYPNDNKLKFAAHMMTVTNNSKLRNNKQFGWLRKQLSLALSDLHSGKTLSVSHIQSIINANTGENSYMFGKTWEELYGVTIANQRKSNLSALARDMNSGSGNPMFGKTWDVRYGHEESTRRKKLLTEKFSGVEPPNKGKTLKEVVGEERAASIQLAMSAAKKGKTWEETLTQEAITLRLAKLSDRLNGKTWEEIHGIDKASSMREIAKLPKSDETRQRMSDARKRFWENKKSNN